eukprot:Anaeramoba_ignava/a222167_10.p1 GENE.a222167_10~~a222167_10.p1  ORF type:complete len:217 (-),score=62.00 a222167_10:515-1165(-)
MLLRRDTPVVKCVLVGDSKVGQNEILISYLEKKYPEGYIQTVFENFSVKLNVDNEEIELSLFQTSGLEEYDSLRPLSYPNSSVVLMFFSIDNHSSYTNIVTKWAGEMRHYIEGVPVILVGNRVELRDDLEMIKDLKQRGTHLISHEEGLELAKKIKAVKYLECSPQTQKGIKTIFDQAVRVGLNYQKSQKMVYSKKRKKAKNKRRKTKNKRRIARF